jgi:RsmE family RNA methyltransferase
VNLIIVEPDEVIDGEVRLGDFRATHIREVLKAGVGSILKVGVADGLRGNGTVLAISERQVELKLELTEESPCGWCDLILAMPRPRVLKRLLPQLAAMGVANIWVTGAARVEKCYFGAHWLHPEGYRPLLIEGLMQAGTTTMPRLHLQPQWNHFTTEILPELSLGSSCYLAHPTQTATPLTANSNSNQKVVLAVGPEGGWLKDELAVFTHNNYSHLSLGPRILRSDTACIALLAVLAQRYDHTACSALTSRV